MQQAVILLTRDLEIRGADNILGRKQHGYILSVCYDLYLKLLDEAVAALSAERTASPRWAASSQRGWIRGQPWAGR